MYIVFLKFGPNRSQAATWMSGHNQWLQREIEAGKILLAGSLEGGLVATLIDTAGATAAARALDGMVATQTMTISFTSPVRIGPAVAKGVPVRVGKRDAVVEVHLTDAGNGDRLCATALLTVVRIGDRPSLGTDGLAAV